MGDVASRVTALSNEKRAWLARRVAALRSGRSGPVALPRRPGVNIFRTSFAQERLWFLEQLAAGSAAYNVAGVFRATGRLDLDALERALHALVARHESFRTTFVASDGVPRQVVSPDGAVTLAIDDRRSIRDGDAVVTLAARETRRPFDVARGPLLRVAVFVVAEERHVVAVTMHHLVADAWSMEIFVRDLARAYGACAAGRDPEWTPARIHYADYAEWQRADLEQPERRRTLTAYWRRQLDGSVYPNVPSGDRLSFRGAAVQRELPAAMVRALHRFVREEGVTLFVMSLAAWVAALGRRVGPGDVTVITPIANRDRPEVSEVIGFFVNLVAIRVTWPSDASFRSLVQRVKDVVRGALVHQELPFEMLLDALGVERSLARPPLSPYAFAVERPIATTVRLPGVEIEGIEIDVATSKTDLTLIVREHEHGIALRLERNVDLHAASSAERMLDDVEAELARGLAAPDAALREPLRGSEHVTLGAASDGGATTVWQRFAAQAARTPDGLAVRSAPTTVSYAQLAVRAARAADRLAAASVRAGSVVAVWGERGVEWIATMLGVWRLGAVYLPLDPRWPLARVVQVVERSGARVVATGPNPPATLAEAAAGTPWTLVAIDPETVAADAARAVGAPTPSAIAYLLYTSGSTGAPKGALIDHAALLNHLEAKCALLGLGADDRVAQTAAAGFDIAIWQAIAALLVGGVVEVLPDDVVRDPVRLVEAVGTREVTVLQLVPAMLRAVLDAESDATSAHRHDPLDGLRWMVVTGEELPPALCRAWLARRPNVALVNAYGPTECGDDVAHHVITTAPEADAVRVPIGRPIAGAILRVLDDALRPVPAGASGELCVSGIPVGRGYLHDPERTAAAFVSPDPFDDRPGTRLYRTGDRGRLRSDGLFEYLGRLDDQMKIRGQRVEPAEVEAVLRMHPGVRDAAAVARCGEGGEASLAAYVVADVPSAELRRYVAERLPDALVPASIVPVATLPRDGNGKLDRRRLLEATMTPVEPACDARRMNDLERRIADIWQGVLGVEVRSAADDFFALGGDSLASLRVVALARRQGLVLTPQQVFEQRTIGALASVVVAASRGEAEQGLVTGAVALTPVQRMFLEARLPEPHHYNLSVLLEVPEPPAFALLTIAVEHVLRHHDALRLRIESDGEGWRQTIADLEGEVPCSRVDLSGVGDDDVAVSIEAEAGALQSTLDLAAGPILRVAWFDLGPRRSSRLLVVVHHLACDVVSLPILLEDLATVYDQLRRGQPVALPAKTASIRSWARALDAHGRAPERVDELAWWRRECADVGARLVGADARPAEVADVEHVHIDLGETETEALLRFASGRAVTLESILATGLVTAVTEQVGGDAVLVYLERHGRGVALDHLDVSRTVGWFTAVFPARLAVAAGRRPAATLELIHRHLSAIPDGGLGYAATWCRDDEVAAVLRSLPRPHISLNYLGRSDPPDDMPWRLAPESAGREHGRRGRRPTVLDLNARIAGGRLVMDWAYDGVNLRRTTIARMAVRAVAAMEQLVKEADRA